jgi:hypothetical protein
VENCEIRDAHDSAIFTCYEDVEFLFIELGIDLGPTGVVLSGNKFQRIQKFKNVTTGCFEALVHCDEYIRAHVVPCPQKCS